MRDDIAELVVNVQLYQEEKLKLLIDFRNKEFKIKNLLSGGIEDDIAGILESQNELIENIDILDFKISGYLDRIKSLSGMELSAAEIKKHFKSETGLSGLTDIIKNINVIIKEIDSLRTENIKAMKASADETSESADQLGRIDRISFRIPKDLQSF